MARNQAAINIAAQLSKSKQHKSNKNRKYGRNKARCALYRQRVGKPLGRGVSGNKAGKNHRRVGS